MSKAIDCGPLAAAIVKAMLDTSFRKELIRDPEKAILNAGLELSPEQLDTLKKLNPEEWESLTLKDLNSRLSAISDIRKIEWVQILPAQNG
jgi:hypothetical protein